MSLFKRFAVFTVIFSLLVAGFAGCQPRFQAGTFTDDAGRQVTLEQEPQRIVSHVPSITEVLFALGLGDRVVGVSDYCDYPAEAKLKPSVGNYWDPSIENIVALEPDLVLTNGQAESIKQLDSLGIKYMVIYPEDIEEILGSIELLGEVTGTEKEAAAVVSDMRARIEQVTGKVENAPKVKVFYTFATTDMNNPWTAGPGSFVDSLITMSGAENIAAAAVSPYVQFSIEEVVSADPSLIILDDGMGSAVMSVEKLREHPIWSNMTAVKEGMIYVVDADLVNRSGPRIVEALEAFARIIHPELFEE